MTLHFSDPRTCILVLLCCALCAQSYTWQRNGFQTRMRPKQLSSAASIIRSCDIYVNDLSKSAALFSCILQRRENAFQLLPGSETMLNLRGIEAPSSTVKIRPLGESFGGICVSVQDAAPIVQLLVDQQGVVELPLAEYKYGASTEPDEDDMKTTPVRYATLRDPNGYVIEVHEPLRPETATPTKKGKISKSKSGKQDSAAIAASGTAASPIAVAPTVAKIILHVEDLDESIEYYTKVLGMKLLRKRSNVNNTPKEAAMIAYVGYESETEGVFIELKYLYSTDKINHGAHPCSIHIGMDDLSPALNAYKAPDKEMVIEEDGTAVLTDPSGYKVHLSLLTPR